MILVKASSKTSSSVLGLSVPIATAPVDVMRSDSSDAFLKIRVDARIHKSLTALLALFRTSIPTPVPAGEDVKLPMSLIWRLPSSLALILTLSTALGKLLDPPGSPICIFPSFVNCILISELLTNCNAWLL